MAYSTGSSTSPDDLLDKLRLFLISEGWSVNKWDTDNTTYKTGGGLIGTGKRLHVEKTPVTGGETLYFNFRSVNRGVIFSESDPTSSQVAGKYYGEVTGLGMYGSTGYDAGEEWDDQPGHPENTVNECWGVTMTELSTVSIPAYHFFSDGNTGDTVVVCVEYESGKFQWFCFGLLEKAGSYTGGQFFSGSLGSERPSYQLLSDWEFQTMFLTGLDDTMASGGVYLNVDSQPGWRANGDEIAYEYQFDSYLALPGIPSNDDGPYYTRTNTINTIWMTRTPNFFNSLAPMIPAYFLCLRASANYCLLGVPYNVRLINPQYYDPGDELVLGSDTWMIFPEHCKDDEDARMGIAVKKVT